MSNPLSITAPQASLGKNGLSELGDWKDVECFPMYRISSTGLVMNKCTLKILKHFLLRSGEETREPSVTLYRAKVGTVVSVQELLDEHFPGAKLVVPMFKKQKMYSKKPQDTNDLFLED